MRDGTREVATLQHEPVFLCDGNAFRPLRSCLPTANGSHYDSEASNEHFKFHSAIPVNHPKSHGHLSETPTALHIEVIRGVHNMDCDHSFGISSLFRSVMNLNEVNRANIAGRTGLIGIRVLALNAPRMAEDQGSQ